LTCFTLEKWGIVMNVPSSATTSEFVVFLVDDDPGVLRAVSRLFQTAGYKTILGQSRHSRSLSEALSNAHTLLAQSRWAGANLHTLVTEELAPYNLQGTSRAHINGPELVLEAKSAQTIAMVLHELTTNAVKYGALSVPSGCLLIEWSRDETQLVIHWCETGGPPVKPPSRQGFGTRVVGRVVHDLEGKLQFDWNPDGLACEIIIPLDHPSAITLKRQ